VRKVCVVLTDRANLGRLSTVLDAIQVHPALELQVVCAGTMPLNRFKRPADIVRAQGFPVNEELWGELEGSTPGTMARSIGLHVSEFTGAFERLNPDIILAIGDRYETLGAGIAAVYTHRCLVHVQGGEISGSLDETARHCLTKMAHYHVPATEQAKENIIRMGELPESVLCVGCPSADLASKVKPKDVIPRYILAVFHPDTNEHDHAAQMEDVLSALYASGEHVVLLWPNIDSGADSISKTIRQFREKMQPYWRYETNVEPEAYLQLLADAMVCVGNSSSFVRDAGYFGSPVVLVGNRQDGRECAENVLRVPVSHHAIGKAIRKQREHGRYPPSDLYGSPGISEQIAARLATVELCRVKRLAYSLEAVA
jgi:UDP-hydrolysing UDP-N-acetyl-D-glucosamine 2-epimerase